MLPTLPDPRRQRGPGQGLLQPQHASAITNGSRYDASSYDVRVLNASVDYVLANNALYTTTSSSLPVWIYWSMRALVVFLVRCLSLYVLASLDLEKREEIYPSPMIKKQIPNSRALLPTFLTKCLDGVSFCPDGVSFCPKYHHQLLIFTLPSHTPFEDMYIHKTPRVTAAILP